jgi:hypothetical protein
MGTVGEKFTLAFALPPWLRCTVELLDERYLLAAEDMELYGGSVFGDASRTSRTGQIRLGLGFPLGQVRFLVEGSGRYESGEGYTIVRLIETGSGLPEDTSRFMDIKTDETVLDAGVTASAGLDAGRLSLDLSGSFSPFADWSISRSRFLTGLTWTQTEVISQGLVVYPTLSWSIRKEALSLEASRYGASLSARYRLRVPAIEVSAFGMFSRLAFTGVSDILVKLYVPYKIGDGLNAVGDLPLEIIEAMVSNAARIKLVHDSLGAGMEIRLTFLKTLLRLRGAPGIAVTYGVQSREQLYEYLEDDPALTAEQWIERYDYFRLILSFGF